jgi:hypothetical protein
MTTPRAARLLALLLGLVGALGAGCSPALGPDYSLSVSNDTTIPVTLVVNAKQLGVIEAGDGLEIEDGDLPPRPWTVELTTAAGRSLATLPVAEGSVVDERAPDGTGSYRAPISRTVLSCGTLLIQVGDTAYRGGGLAEGGPGDCGP